MIRLIIEHIFSRTRAIKLIVRHSGSKIILTHKINYN